MTRSRILASLTGCLSSETSVAESTQGWNECEMTFKGLLLACVWQEGGDGVLLVERDTDVCVRRCGSVRAGEQKVCWNRVSRNEKPHRTAAEGRMRGTQTQDVQTCDVSMANIKGPIPTFDVNEFQTGTGPSGHQTGPPAPKNTDVRDPLKSTKVATERNHDGETNREERCGTNKTNSQYSRWLGTVSQQRT